MFKCFVFVLCAVTIVFCAPGYEKLKEKQSSRQEQVTDWKNDASITKHQGLGKVDIVYLNAESIDPSKLKDLQSKESPRLAPVNDIPNPGQHFQELSDTNLEIVSQNSNYIENKLKSTDDSPLNSLPDDKSAQASDNQYYNSGTGQYSRKSHVRHLPLPPLPGLLPPPPFPTLPFLPFPPPLPLPVHTPPPTPPQQHHTTPLPQVTDKPPANNVESDKNQQQLVEILQEYFGDRVNNTTSKQPTTKAPPTTAPAYPIFQAVAVTPEE